MPTPNKTRLYTKSSGGSGYYDGPASVLAPRGLVFPNTPIIQASHTANWEDYDLTHSNYGYWAYKNSKVDNITVIGKFTANTKEEARYFLGAVHFLRSVTKMHFGENDPSAGTPPPVLLLDSMGRKLFKKVPVIVTNFNTNFEDAYDLVSANDDITGAIGDATYMPAVTMLTITMNVYQNPSDMQKEFTLTDFKSGGLLDSGYI